MRYHDSGTYARQLDRIGGVARRFVRSFALRDGRWLAPKVRGKVRKPVGRRLALVLDIDETTDLARRKRIAVFFITGRGRRCARRRRPTRAREGFTSWNGLSLKPAAFTGTTVAYKRGAGRPSSEPGTPSWPTSATSTPTWPASTPSRRSPEPVLPPPLTPTNRIRASDAERDRTIELLRDAAAEGRLDFEELADRIAAAQGARDRGELERLTGDLPVPSPVGQEVVVPARESRVFGDIHRRGAWPVPVQGRWETLFGDVVLDLREARLAGAEVALEAGTVFGDVIVLVPEGVAVEVRSRTLFGDVRQEAGHSAPAGSPRVVLTGGSVFGDVRVRSERRRERMLAKRRGATCGGGRRSASRSHRLASSRERLERWVREFQRDSRSAPSPVARTGGRRARPVAGVDYCNCLAECHDEELAEYRESTSGPAS